MTNDLIQIRNLKLNCQIGITEAERQLSQVLILNLKIGVDLRKSAQSDSIVDTIDYFELSNRIIEMAKQSKSHLLESLANDIILGIFSNYATAQSVDLLLEKPTAISLADSAGIRLKRDRSNYSF
ncbi:MAG: dihydroneopterin aldolase [Leptonema sp. (in: Bacteria)]|nr:dihydroneopterin aldolase [Leptonema sp. (in: bacteria)]